MFDKGGQQMNAKTLKKKVMIMGIIILVIVLVGFWGIASKRGNMPGKQSGRVGNQSTESINHFIKRVF